MASDYEVFCDFIEQREAERARACKCQPMTFSKNDLVSAFRKGIPPWEGYGWLYRKTMVDRILTDDEAMITDSTIKVEGQMIIGTHPRAGMRQFGQPGRRTAMAAVNWAIMVEEDEFRRRPDSI